MTEAIGAEGPARFLLVLHGQVRGDTLHYWTRQDQLETRAGRTKSQRSRLA
jgi:hypothetical protein